MRGPHVRPVPVRARARPQPPGRAVQCRRAAAAPAPVRRPIAGLMDVLPQRPGVSRQCAAARLLLLLLLLLRAA